MTLVVRYSCDACGLHAAPVEVPVRDRDQPIGEWLDGVRALITRHHRHVSPRCDAAGAADLRIPVAGAAFVGGPAVS